MFITILKFNNKSNSFSITKILLNFILKIKQIVNCYKTKYLYLNNGKNETIILHSQHYSRIISRDII